MANSEKISLREALRSNGRAFAIAWRKWPKVFIATALCQTMHALSPYIGIYLSAQLVNELAGARDVQRLQSWVWAALLSAAVLALLTAVFQRWQNYERDVFHTDLYEIFGKKMTEMDYSCAVADKTLDDLSQIRQNSNWGAWGLYRIWSFFQTAVKSLLSALGAVVLTVSLFTSRVPVESRFAFLNHPAFILAMLGAMAGAILLSSLCGNRISQCWADSAEVNKFGNRIFGYFGYFPSDRSRTMDIRIYNQMRVVSNRLMQFNVYNLTSVLAQRAKKTMGPLEALRAGVSVVFTGGVYLFTCIKAWAGAFGVGSVTQYVGAFTALMGSVAQLFGIVGNMRANAAFLRPVFAFLDVGHEMYQGSLTVEKRSDRKYEIEFRDVSFRYPGSRQYALRHVSMKFRVGERLAIVGQNGSGKTTFIKLLCRLYDPTEGEILLNGIDIRKYDYQEYMSIFSIVFQDFQLLSFTLGENVATRKTYDRERASRCLRQAGFGARLDALENGLDSYLYHDYEEGGIEISGGEAQKIAIARALYKDAPFIILDEPTAALDPIAESEVYTNFDTLVGDKTAIYISHRLSSCRFCDTIAVFDEGQVVQRGTHQQLAAQGGKYAALWNAQAQYYQKKEE